MLPNFHQKHFLFIFQAKVSRHDDGPININEEIIIRHGFSTKDELPTERKHKLNKNGFIKLEFFAPVNASNATALRIEVRRSYPQ